MIALTIICAYLALLLGLGLLSNHFFRGTSRDYMLASQSIGPFFLVLSLFGTTMTSFALVGATGQAKDQGVGVYGLLASSTAIVHALLFFVIGLKLWTLSRRHGYTTQIQFFRERLGSSWFGLLLFPVLIGLVIPYLLIGVVGAGSVIHEVTASEGLHVPKWLASLGICLVVLMYVFFGGMRGTAWANAMQTMVFLVLGFAAFFVIAQGLGQQGGLWENMRVASEAVQRDQPAHLTPRNVAPQRPELLFFAFLLIPASVAMFPHVFQHWLTARSSATFKVPIVAQPLLIMVLWIPTVLIGMWASSSLASLEGVKATDVLGKLVGQYAGPALGGLLTAGILAAIMSSLDSQFLCLGSIFTNDIILHYSRQKTFDERKKVLLARSFVVGVVAVTYLLAQVAPAGVFQIGIWCFSGFTGLVPLVFAALYWRRLTLAGATASVLTVIGLWVFMFWQAGFGANKGYGFPAAGISVGDTLIIPPLMPILPLTIASSVVLIVVSLFTKPPSQATLAKFFEPANADEEPATEPREDVPVAVAK